MCVSGVAGLATLALCRGSRFGLARLTAALAVAAVVVGWAAAQAPRFLPGMTVTQAAAGRSTLVALVIAVACGAVVLVPSLALLYTLFLRGHLDTPESHAPGEARVTPASRDEARAAAAGPSGTRAAGEATNSAGIAGAVSGLGSAGGSNEDARDGTRGAGDSRRARTGRWGAAALVGLVAGAALLVFTDAAWTHVLGVAGLVLCAVAAFALTASPLDR